MTGITNRLLWLAAPSRTVELLSGRFPLVDAPAGGATHILAEGEAANDALRIALAAPEAIAAIVLLAPPAIGVLAADVRARLRDLATPVLALFGTEDAASPPAFGHDWRRGLAKGFVTFVYGATSAMARERPDAVAMLAGEFFSRGEGFLVRQAEGKLFD